MSTINLGKIKFSWKNEWAASETYYAQDVVEHNGSTYICISDNVQSATPPPQNQNFELFVKGFSDIPTVPGDLLFINADGNIENLQIGQSGQALKSINGFPEWTDDPSDSTYKVAKLMTGNTCLKYRAACIMEDGSVRAWGNGANWLLGQGDLTSNRIVPILVPFPKETPKIVEISMSYDDAAYAIDENGHLWVWGRNSYGELGDGSNSAIKLPKNISILSSNNSIFNKTITQIAHLHGANGVLSTAVLDANGEVHVTGYGAYGQVGNGASNRNSFFNISTNKPGSSLNGVTVTKIIGTCERYNTYYALDNTGDVHAWGLNTNGQLGIGTSTGYYDIPVKIGYFDNINITDIIPTALGAFAISDDKKLYGWGYNANGILGLNDTNERSTPAESSLPNVEKVVALANHNSNIEDFALALAGDGALYGAGNNERGQLGNNTSTANVNFTWRECLKSDSNTSGTVSFKDGPPIVKIILAGSYYGNGITYGASYVLDAEGDVWSAGHSTAGNLGTGSSADTNNVFKRVQLNKKIIDIHAGGLNYNNQIAMFLTEDHKLYISGSNTNDQNANLSNSNAVVPIEVIF